MASGKFYATEHAVVVNYFANTEPLLWYYFLEFLNLNQYATATAQPGLSVAKIEEVSIPLPPIQEQTRIIKAIESWFDCVAHIEINSNALNNKISATKAKILELAMQGKLVPQDPNDEPAADMLRRVNPKARIITDNPHSWNIPHGWVLCTLSDVIVSPSSKPYQILQKEIQSTGILPVISQSANFIEGYTNNLEKAYPIKDAIIIFGDHTRNVKYFTRSFVVGADGVKLIEWKFSMKYLYYCTLYVARKIHNKGYSRHFQYLSSYVIGISPLREQIRIVKKIESLYSVLDKIEASLQS